MQVIFIIVQFTRKSNLTPEKLIAQIRPKSRMEEIQTNGKMPMVLVKAKSRLKDVDFYLILNEYIMTDKSCTREKWQGWGLIRRLKTWNKPSRRACNMKVRLPGKNKKDIPNISGEMQPSHHPGSSGQPASAAWSPAPTSLFHSGQLCSSHRKHPCKPALITSDAAIDLAVAQGVATFCVEINMVYGVTLTLLIKLHI